MRVIINIMTLTTYLKVKCQLRGETMQIFDITIPLSEDTPVWEGDNGVQLIRTESLSKGDGFNVTEMYMGVHSGTHIDAPFHLFEEGDTVNAIPLEKLVGEVQVIALTEKIDVISPEILDRSGFDSKNKRLLLKTKNSKFWKDDPYTFRKDFTAINQECAQYLVDSGIYLVGIDYFSISPLSDLKPAHEILLRSGIAILENIHLGDINPGIYQLICLPLKLIGTDGAPARVILIK